MTTSLHAQPPAALDAIEKATAESGFGMPSDRETGSLLRMLCVSRPARRFLEIGTGTGLSACWMLDGMDSKSILLSIDIDPDLIAIAKAHISDVRAHLIPGDALETMASLEPDSFDLIFADALPGKYEEFDLTVSLLRSGGICVLDDMLPQSNWPENHQPRVDALMQKIASDPALEYCFLNWSTGIVLCTKR